MALYQKQDFTPSVLSIRWISMQFRPNMLLYCQDHVLSILESGLLFREDSVEIDQEAMCWMEEGYGTWLTTGEKLGSALAVTSMFVLPPLRNFYRGSLLRISSLMAVPAVFRSVHRWRCGGYVLDLLNIMCDYLGVARRAAACCREYAALHNNLESVLTVVDSMEKLLIQQQAEMVNILSRASSAVLGNAPWLRGDLAWEAVCRPGDSLMKIHHTFLVVQSLLLKHIAMAHYMSPNGVKLYKNHNERIYWIHNVVIKYLISEYKSNHDSLERMYRLLKNCGTADKQNENKKLGSAFNDNWVYSEVHTDIARSCLELKIAHSKCNNIDMFLDACGMNRTQVDLNVLNKDIDDLIETITKCLATAQDSQIRLHKLQNKVKSKEPKAAEEVIEQVYVVKAVDEFPKVSDEVFYLMKTDEDENVEQPSTSADVVTGPGLKEKETSKVVLRELKRKLGRREDIMRERERQALKKTMPQFKDNVPEFPRQISLDEFVEKTGFIKKILKEKPKRKLFQYYDIKHTKKNQFFKKCDKYLLAINASTSYSSFAKIKDDFYVANTYFTKDNVLLTVSKNKDTVIVTKWCELLRYYSDRLSDIEEESVVSGRSGRSSVTLHAYSTRHDPNDFRYSKNDMQMSPTSSEEEFREILALVGNAKRHRAVRDTGEPSFDDVDDSLRPMEYRFGTGMAMASVLQGNSPGKRLTLTREDVYVGDGEVSEDSGNSGGE